MKSISNLMNHIGEFEATIGYVFADKSNAVLALTHSSFANESKNEKIKSNERLEFLGDSILSFVISENIYSKFPSLTEGEMTKVRASIVCEPSLMKCANNINLGKYLLLGKGEEFTGGRTRISILSDAFEAVIGAIFIDGGMEKAKIFICKNMEHLVGHSVSGLTFNDYKTILQEIIQKSGEKKISYEIVAEKGPDHSKLFISQVRIADEVKGTGEGKSKKEAEQNAAKAALDKISENIQ